MLKRFLNFYDAFMDGETKHAIRIFENPFDPSDAGSSPKEETAAEIQAPETPGNGDDSTAQLENQKRGRVKVNSFKITLKDRKLESRIQEQHKKKNDLDINLMKVQAFILTYLDADRRNILHLACNLGDYPMVKFIVEQATSLGILDIIVHAVDEMQLPPIYLLCQRGYKKEFDKRQYDADLYVGVTKEQFAGLTNE